MSYGLLGHGATTKASLELIEKAHRRIFRATYFEKTIRLATLYNGRKSAANGFPTQHKRIPPRTDKRNQRKFAIQFFEIFLYFLKSKQKVNKPGTAQVGAISKAQKDSKTKTTFSTTGDNKSSQETKN